MHYWCRVHAFTMLGEVHLAATVRSEGLGAAIEPVLTLSTAYPDDGEPDPHAFLRDALVALLEVLPSH